MMSTARRQLRQETDWMTVWVWTGCVVFSILCWVVVIYWMVWLFGGAST